MKSLIAKLPKLHWLSFWKSFKLFVPKVPLDTFCSLWIDDCQLWTLYNNLLPKLPLDQFRILSIAVCQNTFSETFRIVYCQNCHLTIFKSFQMMTAKTATMHFLKHLKQITAKTATWYFVSFQFFAVQTATTNFSQHASGSLSSEILEIKGVARLTFLSWKWSFLLNEFADLGFLHCRSLHCRSLLSHWLRSRIKCALVQNVLPLKMCSQPPT